MSYPPPPGLKTSTSSGSSTPQPHPSLPARPPPSASSSFKPTFPNASSSVSRAPGAYGPSIQSSNFNSFAAFKPRSVATTNPATNNWRSSQQPGGPSPQPYHTVQQNSFPGANSYPQQQQAYQDSYHSANYSQQNGSHTYSQPAPPQIQNPFPLPGQSSGGGRGYGRDNNPPDGSSSSFDPEMEAQIAQWQSAYMSKDESQATGARTGVSGVPSAAGGANAVALGPRAGAAVAGANPETAGASKGDANGTVTGPDGKQKTVVRSGGGQTWQDTSLLEWDPAHFRLFVGNLAGEVTDESLLKAFSKYDSVQKGRVIRDKRTTKSKGYGFVSFSNGDDYFQAAKEMQGKYIGSHPVLLRRATTEVRPTSVSDKNKNKGRGKGGGAGEGGKNGGGHANTGSGVHKKQNKTKGGLKILG